MGAKVSAECKRALAMYRIAQREKEEGKRGNTLAACARIAGIDQSTLWRAIKRAETQIVK